MENEIQNWDNGIPYNIAHYLDADMLIEKIADKGQAFAFQFIKELDLHFADYDFTEELYNYFKSEMEKENAKT